MSSPEIPVDYDLAGKSGDWIPSFGTKYEKWYPAPYTVGRSFDYTLLRGYGLKNSQEGLQFRSFGTGRYLITYGFNPKPTVQGHSTRDAMFGGLRVTVVLGK